MGAGLLLVLSNGPVLRFATGCAGPARRGRGIGTTGRSGRSSRARRQLQQFSPGSPGVRAATQRVRLHGRWRRSVACKPLARRPRARLSRPALVAIGWYSAAALASSLWSVYASATLWRSVVYLGLILLAVALARFTDDELSTALVLLASVAVAGSLAVIVLQHDVGVDRHGNWIGMYTNRNSLAPLAAFGVIAGLRWLSPRSTPFPRHGPRRGGSATGTISSGRPAWHFGTRRRCRRNSGFMATRLGRGACGGIAGDPDRCGQPHRLVGAGSCAGRGFRRSALRRPARPGCAVGDRGAPGPLCSAEGWWLSEYAWPSRRRPGTFPTLSQRRAIWGLAWDRVLERPWGGYGFFAFWEVPELVQEHVLLQLRQRSQQPG